MIDYEITVSVNNLTQEEKKRVQDAFFKLGLTWLGGTNYSCLNKGCYTNTFNTGRVTQDLMWADAITEPTHTVDELLELAGMKIGYEITVDVSNEDVETKKQVQDAFFKLGFGWRVDGYKHIHLDKTTYTNTYDDGDTADYLLFNGDGRNPTHTIKELLELAGMKQERNTTTFNLERALAGEPVVTRNGKEVTQLTLFQTDSEYNLVGVVDGGFLTYTTEGEYLTDEFHNLDLFMKAKTHTVNGFEVPTPITDPENMKSGVTYYGADNTDLDWYFETTWSNDEMDNGWIVRNLVFMNKEDAIANAKAMSGVNPYGGCNE